MYEVPLDEYDSPYVYLEFRHHFSLPKYETFDQMDRSVSETFNRTQNRVKVNRIEVWGTYQFEEDGGYVADFQNHLMTITIEGEEWE